MQTSMSLSICLFVCAFSSAYPFLYLADSCFNLNFFLPLYIHKEVNEQKKGKDKKKYNWTSKMINLPPCRSHEGMKLLDIFLFSLCGTPAAVSSAAFYSQKISGSDLAQIWSVCQRWPTARGSWTLLDHTQEIPNGLRVPRGRSYCTLYVVCWRTLCVLWRAV